jgi:hypothetical protein
MSVNRRSFRPGLTEVLEERVVPSHVATASIHAAAVHASALPTTRNTPVPLGPVGALGDSYTDEYQFYAPDRVHARNWVEILHALRGVSFGPFTKSDVRGEPRNQGFAYNWAESAATSSDMIANQLPGLTAQVASGDIRYAWVFIGGNDYLRLLQGVATGQISPVNALPALQQTTAQLEINFTTAFDTLLAANPNVKVVVATLPDVATLPIAQSAAKENPMIGVFLQYVGQAITQYDNLIRTTAASNPRVALADLAGVLAQLQAGATGPTTSFGGITVNLTTPGDDYHNFFLADLIHIGTLGQTLVADTFATAIDTKFAANLFPVTPQEAVPFARSVYLHSLRTH